MLCRLKVDWYNQMFGNSQDIGYFLNQNPPNSIPRWTLEVLGSSKGRPILVRPFWYTYKHPGDASSWSVHFGTYQYVQWTNHFSPVNRGTQK